jgi:cytochrome c oxidase assembly protein subunit 15
MTTDRPSVPRSTYQPTLAWLVALGSAWVFVLIMLGAFTTSYNVGMIFPDWPLSNGSLNPEGWLSDLAKFLEHSHRLSAGMMSLITIAIAVGIWIKDERVWLRNLALGAVALVFIQALVGGLRVLLEHHQVEMINTSVGRLFAMLHACLAQVYICALASISVAVSRPWIEGRTGTDGASALLRGVGRFCCALLLLQLAIAAVMRHSFAGLAIPTFPWSSPDGGVLPASWDFRVGIHFAHRAMALVLSVALIGFAAALGRERAVGRGAKGLAGLMIALLALQITLGAMSVLSERDPHLTTAHVIVGALLLADTFIITWLLHRDVIESVARTSPAAAVARQPSPFAHS